MCERRLSFFYSSRSEGHTTKKLLQFWSIWSWFFSAYVRSDFLRELQPSPLSHRNVFEAKYSWIGTYHIGRLSIKMYANVPARYTACCLLQDSKMGDLKLFNVWSPTPDRLLIRHGWLGSSNFVLNFKQHTVLTSMVSRRTLQLNSVSLEPVGFKVLCAMMSLTIFGPLSVWAFKSYSSV